MKFETIKNERVYRMIVDQFAKMIYRGELKKGDKIPSERQLSQLLGVGRSSIREALSAMTLMGIIESRPGEGTFIINEISTSIIQPLSLVIALEKNHNDFIELRKILESECARIAAFRRSEKCLSKIENQLIIMEENNEEIVKAKADKEFHRAIIEATGNILMIDIIEAISEAIEIYIIDARKKLLRRSGNVEILLVQHRNIFKAIKNMDAERAHMEMKKHIDFVEEELKRIQTEYNSN